MTRIQSTGVRSGTPRARVAGVARSAAVACGLGLAALGAQEPGDAAGGDEPPAAQGSAAEQPEAQEPESGSTPVDADAAERYARVDAETVPLRCFPTDHSPTFDEMLASGDVVKVAGAEREGFLPVALPLGVAGYVHGDYVELGENGVATATSKVSFRHEPQSGRAPVTLVERGEEFRLLDRDGDWLRVRNPEQTAWVPVDAVVVVGAATAEASWRDLAERQEAALQEVVDAIAAEKAHAARLDELRERASELRTAIAEEQTKATADENWQPLVDATAAFVESVGDDPELSTVAAQLAAEAARQQRIHAAATTLARPVERPDRPEERTAPVANPMERFTATGWLRVTEPLLFGEERVRIEKGEQPLFRLVCTSGRYDLSIFRNLSVAVIGETSRPDPEQLRVLDVQRVEVLGRPEL